MFSIVTNLVMVSWYVVHWKLTNLLNSDPNIWWCMRSITSIRMLLNFPTIKCSTCPIFESLQHTRWIDTERFNWFIYILMNNKSNCLRRVVSLIDSLYVWILFWKRWKYRNVYSVVPCLLSFATCDVVHLFDYCQCKLLSIRRLNSIDDP